MGTLRPTRRAYGVVLRWRHRHYFLQCHHRHQGPTCCSRRPLAAIESKFPDNLPGAILLAFVSLWISSGLYAFAVSLADSDRRSGVLEKRDRRGLIPPGILSHVVDLCDRGDACKDPGQGRVIQDDDANRAP